MMDGELQVSRPFKNLDELYSNLSNLVPWPLTAELRESADYVFHGSQMDVQDKTLEKVSRDEQPKTIICHDMKGGYLEDRFIDGTDAHDSYVFYHWSIVDTFIYFSHHLVTIPPYGWINAAHMHGVKVLGTVITEWTDGQKVWERVFESTEETKKFADALIYIAKFYKFEGWLLNVENKIKETDVEKLKFFVKYLTDGIHREIEESEIIWYDSVTCTGEIKWQNELSDQNECFFTLCDGIFLNYTWTDSGLIRSRERAMSTNRVRDVYVGLDVWGRGCPGGGGFNSKHALERIRQHGLSVAIFAPGWTHEYFKSQSFQKIESIFWAQLVPYLYIHVPLYDNEAFATSFCRGAGTSYYHCGKIKLERQISDDMNFKEISFYNLAMQKPQVSISAKHLKFIRKEIIVRPAEPVSEVSSKDSNAPRSKEQIEFIYETAREIMKVVGSNITFQPKTNSPGINYFEFYDASSYNGGGCLMMVTENPKVYHRLFLVYVGFIHEIQVSIVYREIESNTEQQDILQNGPVLILGNDTGLKSIRSSESIDLDSRWKKSIYTTNLKTVNEIGVAFPRRGVCCLGEIVLEQKQRLSGKFNTYIYV